MPIIEFSVDGQILTPSKNITWTTDWDNIIATWNSGSTSGVVTLKIINQYSFLDNAGGGNDFAMDDIIFSSGNGTQTHDVTILVNDCFTISAANRWGL